MEEEKCVISCRIYFSMYMNLYISDTGGCKFCIRRIRNEWVEAVEWFIWRRRFKEEATTHLLPLDWRKLLIFWICSPFILNDTFQQRNESFTRDVEIKMKHGQICHYTPNVTDLMIPRKAQVLAQKNVFDHDTLC